MTASVICGISEIPESAVEEVADRLSRGQPNKKETFSIGDAK
jgi:hypothetical protein